MWPDSSETQELLTRAEGGETAAVNQLMERHRQSLRKMVQLRMDRALSQRIDASDIVQDVLLEASQRLVDYIKDARMPFHLWLRQLAKDQLIDTHRRHRVAQRRSLDREQPLVRHANADHSSLDLAAQLQDQELTPAAAALRKEFQQRFYQALAELEEDDRELILMRHVEQLSNSDVAQSLGLSQPAAGMRHLRALRRLREILGDSTSLPG
ncbi:MAG: polymerase sigma-70 factor, Planctomycetaceae-specific subfamily 1 [Planctomycetaceae bacterium]|nr:polymerase sigma-70 factor, Planctomycetaceae-specific subfamily 1 [Planctomycetaceae bacterium]